MYYQEKKKMDIQTKQANKQTKTTTNIALITFLLFMNYVTEHPRFDVYCVFVKTQSSSS